jgi:hypothetical protein
MTIIVTIAPTPRKLSCPPIEHGECDLSSLPTKRSPHRTPNPMQDTSDSDEDLYEPQYETELIRVYEDVQFNVMTVIPPPLEYLATLHQDRQEISGRKVWTGSLLLARFLCSRISTGELSLDSARYGAPHDRRVGTTPCLVHCL